MRLAQNPNAGAGSSGPKCQLPTQGATSDDNIAKRADSSVEFHEGKERHRHDEHDDSDHENSLQCSAADIWNTLRKRLAMQYSNKRFFGYMEASQIDRAD
jgi:hypothetical protein